jgi:hypothetical protein
MAQTNRFLGISFYFCIILVNNNVTFGCHINKGKNNMNEKINTEEIFQCVCGKQFKSKNSLSGHKANCKVYLNLLKH